MCDSSLNNVITPKACGGVALCQSRRKDNDILLQSQLPNLIGKISGHVDGSRTFKRYRNIEDETLKSVINLIG